MVIDVEPPTGFVPDQLPDAEQVLASVDDQFSVIVPPRLTLEGLAVRLTVGAVTAGGSLTVIVTLSLSLPLSLLQVIVYVVVVVGLTVSEPLAAVLDVHPAVQVVASVEVQLSIADCP